MPLFKYEAVAAKCKCLYGKLLGGGDYENLLRCADVSDVAGYLYENTAYREFLDVSDLRRINRNKLEYYIKKSLLYDYIKMFKFTCGNQRHFIKLLMAKYELEYILKVWREYVWKNIENNPIPKKNDDYFLSEGILEIQAIYKDNPRIDLEALKNIATAGQFMGAIKNSDFFYIFEKHISEDISKNYTTIETAVYDEYYKILYDGAKMFEKATADRIRDSISTRADLTNLCRISRLRFSFRAAPAEIAPLLAPLRNKLKDGDIEALLNCGDKESFLSYCQAYLHYGKKQRFFGFESLAAYMNSFMYGYCKSGAASTGFEIVARYFQLKEFEIMNLFYLTEGIRYKMPPDYIRKNIYGSNDPAKGRG
ncbi:MAG: V-type ATPase subunit [Oscillospiraceae bacterium]|nr:V-type ATPase subunit [Oscillospiraceae bacterium]